jgi:hypothetical protein
MLLTGASVDCVTGSVNFTGCVFSRGAKVVAVLLHDSLTCAATECTFRARLESEGYALFDLTAAEDGSMYRDTIVKMYIPSSPLPYHSLSRVSRCN